MHIHFTFCPTTINLHFVTLECKCLSSFEILTKVHIWKLVLHLEALLWVPDWLLQSFDINHCMREIILLHEVLSKARIPKTHIILSQHPNQLESYQNLSSLQPMNQS